MQLCFNNKIFLTFFLLIFLLFNKTLSSQAGISQEDISKLIKGDVIATSLPLESNNSSTVGVESKIFINASPEKVWTIVSDQEKIPAIIPDCKKVNILEKTENVQKVQYFLKVSPFLPTFKYTLAINNVEKYKKMKFNKIDGCFNKLYGAFELEPYKNGTILTYKMFLDPGFFVPHFVCENGIKNILPDILKGLRSKAEN